MIYKVVTDKVAERVRDGYLRIGSLNYYKYIEDEYRKDGLEGIPDKIIGGENGQIIAASEFNAVSQSVGSIYRMKEPLKMKFIGGSTMSVESNFNVHVFCASIGVPETKERKNKFGEQIFEIINPNAFSRVIADILFDKYQDGDLEKKGGMDSVSFGHTKVIYSEGKNSLDYVSHDNGVMKVNSDAVFIKPLCFKDESEYRFIWFPYSNFKKMACSLPHNHKYIDIRIDKLINYIRWI